MIHDLDLLDRLSAFDPIKFGGEVFRATRKSLDPLTPSTSGGRWAPKDGPAVLYMSTEGEGALAEIAFHWSQFYPLPSKPAALHRIGLTARRTMRLLRADLVDLGVDWARYGEMSYERSQVIGAAAAFLERDGLLAPSARWSLRNRSPIRGQPCPR
ncbi:MAG: RES family NAD+ phosphorylase [Pseudomonadota bacterium]|nr:RES family NAD+ phosphorylase [Gammaproteobacteria bacterium]MDQ3581998.1 RES family NAD+ phosphorylase [Pseudomonadota bacterium]